MTGEVNAEFADTVESLAKFLGDRQSLNHDDVRQTVLKMLSQRGYQLPELDQRTAGFTLWYEVIMAAASQHGALNQLAGSVWLVDRSKAAEDFQDKVNRLLPSEIFTLRERFEFIAFVRESVPDAELNRYFRLAADELPDRDLRTAEELVSELEEILIPGPVHSLIRLTEAIADANVRRGIVRQAMEWSMRLAGRADEPGPARRQDMERGKWLLAPRKRGPGRSASAAAREPVALVQVIEPSGAGKDRYLYRAWMYRDAHTREPEVISADDSARSLDGVREQAGEALRQVVQRLGPDGPADIDLEFFLPRQLLWYPVEDWGITQNASLGTHYVVVVRDLGRIQEPMLRPGWQRKWARYADDSAADGLAAAGAFGRWVTCADAPFEPGALTRDLRADECFAVALTFPPRPRGQHVDLAEALDAGTAIMLWPRRHCVHSGGAAAERENCCAGLVFKQEISRRLTGGRLADLPKVVWEMRKEQRPGDGSGVVLLWDNPEHWPGVREFRLDSPHPLEEP